jgi:hypothetical protein
MRLEDIVERLEVFDNDATIYAETPWRPDARAVVAIEPEDGSLPAEAIGLTYFLEVDIALDAARGTTGSRFQRVLYYAENDAYLPEQ